MENQLQGRNVSDVSEVSKVKRGFTERITLKITSNALI